MSTVFFYLPSIILLVRRVVSLQLSKRLFCLFVGYFFNVCWTGVLYFSFTSFLFSGILGNANFMWYLAIILFHSFIGSFVFWIYSDLGDFLLRFICCTLLCLQISFWIILMSSVDCYLGFLWNNGFVLPLMFFGILLLSFVIYPPFISLPNFINYDAYSLMLSLLIFGMQHL